MSVAAALVGLVLATLASAAPPNIIFILSDDLGYGDYSVSEGVNRTTSIPTPNIQRLASSGLKLVRSYTGPICAPSRCTLMTGRDMGHCTIRGNDGTYSPLTQTDVTVAAVLKTAGYTTGLVGKWGLGDFGTSGYPLQQGFDYYVGQDSQVACHDWYPTTVNNNTLQRQPLNDKHSLGPGCLDAPLNPSAPTCTWANDLTKAEALGFIRRHAHGPKPFFLYLSTTTPHVGMLLGERSWYPVPYPYNQASFLDSSWPRQLRDFASAVWAQDQMVGAVLDELEALDIEKDTVVFFSGDNGPDEHDFTVFDDTGPFRGKKGSLHEGGVRQTIAVQWTGTLAAGSRSTHLFAFWDLLPTAAELAGLARDQWPATEGISIAPLLTGDVASQESHQHLYWEFCFYKETNGLLPQLYAPGWIQALRFDAADGTEWKAIRSNREGVLLFNLTADVSESVDLAREKPSVVTRLTRLMDVARSEALYWPSVASSKEKCCGNCYSAEGCPAPCFSPNASAMPTREHGLSAVLV